jgi:serine/threonine-protein kinase
MCSACSQLGDSTTTYCGQCGERTVHDRLLGTVLDGRYRIAAKIAAGGFGTIYRAVSIDTAEEVAIKVLHDQHTTNPTVSARFRRESVAMSSLCDAHTVTTYEVGEDPDGTRFIVMELLRGESLADRFAACGTLHWRNVLSIIRAVCSSLAEAHALGIVHRDLKPANIFLAQQPAPDFVKVLDFGVAKIVHGSTMDDGSELTRIGQAVGTLEYMSPEQLVGGELDQRTDIYTLGVVAYEMITGRRPFSDVTGATGLVTALMTRRPPPPSTIAHGPLPPMLDGVLLRCLERDAEDRYAGVGELAAAIDRMLEFKVDFATTQRLWRNANRPVFADSDDELTWIDARPPFELPPAAPDLQELVALDATPLLAMHDAVRSQIVSNPHPPVVPATSVLSESEPSDRRAWRVAGTGVAGFGFGDEPTQTKTATPRSQLAVGSSAVIANSLTTAPVAAAPMGFAKIAVFTILLTLLGLGIGAGVATFVL